MISVCALSLAPVKGTRLLNVERIRVEHTGVRENRRFFLIDERDRMVNASRLGVLNTIISDYSDAERRLALRLPDGTVVEDAIALGDLVQTRFYSDAKPAHLVIGPWSAAITSVVGQSLRLVEAVDGDSAVDRGAHGGMVSLISRASVERLATEGQVSSVDARRFRMLVEVDGVPPHEEDHWVGRRVQIGESVVEFVGHVGRCVITSRNAETGEVDLHTLKLLGRYRRDEETTEPVAFGIYGSVVSPGDVRVGDPVVLDGTLSRS